MINILLIYIIIIGSAISMILTTNPIYGLKFLILIFLNFAFLLIYFNLSYLGFIFIMVYVGAVTVLFLFVVMMLDIKQNIIYNTNYITIGFLFVIILSILIFSVIHNNFTTLSTFEISNNLFYYIYNNDYIFEISNLNIIGIILFNYYYLNLLLVGFILLVATIGSIYLTHNIESITVRKQFNQLHRTNSFYICINK